MSALEPVTTAPADAADAVVGALRAGLAALRGELRHVEAVADDLESVAATPDHDATRARAEAELVAWIGAGTAELGARLAAARVAAAERVRSAHEAAANTLGEALGVTTGEGEVRADVEPTAPVAAGPGGPAIGLDALLQALSGHVAATPTAELSPPAVAMPGPTATVAAVAAPATRHGLRRLLYADVILPMIAVVILVIILLALVG